MSRARLGVGRMQGAPLAVALAVFAVLAPLYAWTMAPSISVLHDNLDGAELIAVADVLGVAHPPGSALWMPLGKAALEGFVFLEEPAQRANLLSALCMAAACALVGVAAVRWRPETPTWAGILAGVLAGVAPIPWAQALVTEVLALQALLTALALVLVVDAIERPEGWAWPAFALVLGLAAWNHPVGLAVAVPLAAAAVLRGRPEGRSAGLAVALFALPGVYTVAYLLWRADAPIAWGDTGTLSGVWEHLSGRVYQDVVERDPAALAQAVPETIRYVMRQSFPLAWPLVPLGAIAIARVRPALAGALLVASVILVLFVSGYRATGRQDYLAPVAFALALGAAWGADEAWTWVRGRLHERWSILAAGTLAWALVAVWAVANGSEASRRGDTTLRDAAIARLEATESGATIVTSDDRDTFSLWYARLVLGVRPDVGIEDVRGLAPTIPAEPPAEDALSE